ncbi:MAG TPA: hypothetical protein VFW62_03840, partial [bacterium]|nr:hypothetical protein [bacterium]
MAKPLHFGFAEALMISSLFRIIPDLESFWAEIEPLKDDHSGTKATPDRFLTSVLQEAAPAPSAEPDDIERDGLKRLELWL